MSTGFSKLKLVSLVIGEEVKVYLFKECNYRNLRERIFSHKLNLTLQNTFLYVGNILPNQFEVQRYVKTGNTEALRTAVDYGRTLSYSMPITLVSALQPGTEKSRLFKQL